jgi:hypothetical protein
MQVKKNKLGTFSLFNYNSNIKRHISALFIYFAVIFAYLYRGYRPSNWVVFSSTDASQFINYMSWWVYAITHFINPFINTRLYNGHVNMMYVTSAPLLAVLSLPVNILFGPVAAYDAIAVLAMPLSAYAAFVLVYYLTKNYFGSIIGGFFYGFSAYCIGETIIGDINLSSVYLIPLIAFVVLLKLDEKISAKLYVFLMSLMLAAQFLIFDEIYADLTVSGFIAIFLYYVFYKEQKIFKLISLTILSYLFSLIIVSPFLYYALARRYQIMMPPRLFLNKFYFAINPVFHSISYIGPYLLIVVFLYIIKSKNYFLPTLLVVFSLLSSFYFFSFMPLLKEALPDRFVIYADLIISIIAGFYFSKLDFERVALLILTVGSLATLSMAIIAHFKSSFNDTPVFFQTSLYKKYIKSGSEVLVLPLTFTDDNIRYQAIDNFYYKMPVGYYYNVNYILNKRNSTRNFNYLKYGKFFYLPRGYSRRLLNYFGMYNDNKKGFNAFLKKHNVKYIAVVCKSYSKRYIKKNYSYSKTWLSKLSSFNEKINACNLFKFSYKHVKIGNTILYFFGRKL